MAKYIKRRVTKKRKLGDEAFAAWVSHSRPWPTVDSFSHTVLILAYYYSDFN